MAENGSDAGAAGGGSSSSSAAAGKPKAETTSRKYTVVGAVGAKDSDPAALEFRVIGTAEATTQAAAKEAILDKDPNFPGRPGEEGKLSALVGEGLLWLLADSGWSPKLVEVEQPPPKFTGL
jgi:hypothetical protein